MRDSTGHLDRTGFTNHLANESSPYLLQHAHNPVDWYPWSREALDKAKREDKPIFLSVGYAACHWCHVMEKESFEDEAIAGMLNRDFVSIKVDREQRPDLDQIYMAATLALTGTGGWPMSVFLTPTLKPFFAGTYFAPENVNGRPGFKHVLSEIAGAYKNERGKIDEFSVALSDLLMASLKPKDDRAALNKSIVDHGVRELVDSYDPVCGGFGKAPKFHHPTELSFLLKIYSVSKEPKILRIAEHTLSSMARGGIYDQIGGGFHRYSTDSRWLVPHFEKMLYDNALLAVAYSEAYQITGNEFYRKIAQETLDYILRDTSHRQGAFYSSLDADSEGEEGKFYSWTKAEIEQLLKDKSEVFCRYYNVSDGGNFGNRRNILNLDSSSDKFRERSEFEREEFDRIMTEGRMILLAARSKKKAPFTDDKILTSWNGLVISAFSKGYQITMNDVYREAALKAARFIKDSLMQNGHLFHSYREGKRSDGLFLEDYAYLTAGLIDLYEIAYDYDWVRLASSLARNAVRLFSDENGHLFLSPADQEDHYIRPREIPDGALPAAGSILIQSLLKLADITGENDLHDFAKKSLDALSENIEASPSHMTSALTAIDYLFSDRTQLVLVGTENREKFLREIYLRYIPNRVLVVSDHGSEEIPFLGGRKTDGRVKAYVCRNSVCLIPADNPEELKKQLDEILP